VQEGSELVKAQGRSGKLKVLWFGTSHRDVVTL